MNIYKRVVGSLMAFVITTGLFAGVSINANLSGIEISNKGINLVTDFVSTTTIYAIIPSPFPTEVTLRAFPADKKAKVTIKIGTVTYSNHTLVGLVYGDLDVVFMVTAEDGLTTKEYTVSLTTGGGGGSKSLETPYYSTNPNGGVGKASSNMIVVKNANMTSDGFTDWSSDMMIAQSASNDICQSFKGSHEYPIFDTYALYASWDDTYLYLGWQYVNVIDITDSSQGGQQTDNGKPWNGEHRITIALDLFPGKSGKGVMSDGITGVWDGTGKVFNLFENGLDCMIMTSPKPGSGVPGVFRLNDQGTFDLTAQNFTTFTAGGVVFGYIDGLLPSITKVYGINKAQAWAGYSPSELEGTVGFVDMLALGHKKTQDTFYEMKIPFAVLGITRSYLELNGIGAMLVSTYGNSGTTSIPYDSTVYDHVTDPYGADASSSAEKDDLDTFTYNMARIGKK